MNTILYTVIKIEAGWITLSSIIDEVKEVYAVLPREAFKGNVYYGMQALLEGREA